MQSGPGFPYLADWVVDYILGEDPSNLPISKEYITLSEMTSTLLNLTEEALHGVLETHPKSAAFWEVINASEWSSTELITIGNKGCLVHELIHNELVRCRKDQLDSLRKGLESLGFLYMLKMHRKVAVHVLSFRKIELTADIFTAFLKSSPNSNAERQAYQWFLDYITSSDCVRSTELYYISGDRALAKEVWQKTWRISIPKVPLRSLDSCCQPLTMAQVLVGTEFTPP